MKNRNLVYIFSLTIIVFGLIGYSIYGITKIFDTTTMTKKSAETQLQAYDTLSEFYLTQLELWEYFYEPSDERLSLFNIHNQILNEKINKLVLLTKDDPAMFKELDSMISPSDDIDRVWTNAIAKNEELLKIKKENGSSEKITKLTAMVRQSNLESEQFIDNLELDKKIQNFVTDQTKKIMDDEKTAKQAIQTSQIILLALAFAYVLLFIFVVVWFENIIRKLKEKK